jgi:predicted metal-dependent peptidase
MNPQSNKDLLLKLDKARWWALGNQPFYGTLAMHLHDRIDEGTPTASTNGQEIYWGPEFLAGLSEEETRFVLLHEALHCAHGHLWRFPADAADHERANVACDHAINLTLGGVDGVKEVKGCLADGQYRGLAEEEIYNRLPKDEKGGGPMSGDMLAPATGQGDEDDGNGTPQETPQETLRERWQRNLIQAVQAARASGRGDVPADLARELDRLCTLRVDWRRETADFVREVVGTRNDWSRAARRHAWQPVIYPRRHQDGLGLVIFVRDTSGSISNDICAEFSGLIGQCLADTGCSGLVLDCDEKIHAEHWLGAGEECPTTASGGGGTDFCAPFARATALAEEGHHIAGLVYLTDLAGGEPAAEDVTVPTLWLCTTDRVAESGRTIKIV